MLCFPLGPSFTALEGVVVFPITAIIIIIYFNTGNFDFEILFLLLLFLFLLVFHLHLGLAVVWCYSQCNSCWPF